MAVGKPVEPLLQAMLIMIFKVLRPAQSFLHTAACTWTYLRKLHPAARTDLNSIQDGAQMEYATVNFIIVLWSRLIHFRSCLLITSVCRSKSKKSPDAARFQPVILVFSRTVFLSS